MAKKPSKQESGAAAMFEDDAMSPEELAEQGYGFIGGPNIQADRKRGLFVHSETKATSDTLTLTVLGSFGAQKLWGGKRSPWPEVKGWICANDFASSAESRPYPNTTCAPKVLREAAKLGAFQACSSCELSKFDGDDPPACQTQQIYLVMPRGEDAERFGSEPIQMMLNGKSLTPAKVFFKGDAFRTPKGGILPPCVREVTATMAKAKGDGGEDTYVVAWEETDTWLPDRDELKRLRELGQQLLTEAKMRAVQTPRAGLVDLLPQRPSLALPAPQPGEASVVDDGDEAAYRAFSEAQDDFSSIGDLL